MTKVAILPVTTHKGNTSYHAIAGKKQSAGTTAGAALDALTEQLPADEASTLVIVQMFRPDQFFTAAQQQRLEELMTKWHSAQDNGVAFSAQEQAELEALIETELEATTRRAAALADDVGL
ncbi:MAG: hypothetical protein MUD01_17645 [Chloroflexaceae bacterium]|nr:hypothetical protein [Chloroflexaceae bacterium]